MKRYLASIISKWHLALKILPLILLILVSKFFVNYFEYNFLTLSSLFGAIISANVFLIGFLISGVLGDYKEAEKLPGEIASGLEVLVDEARIILMKHKSQDALNLISTTKNLTAEIIKWFHKETRTVHMYEMIADLNVHFANVENLTQANFIVRMKQEQSNLRKHITRIHTVRETSFNPVGYAIAEFITFLLCIGLIFTSIEPYYEGYFFVGFVSYMLIYMVALIKDLDNPFGHYDKRVYEDEVSLKPIYDLQIRIDAIQLELNKNTNNITH